MAMQPRPWRRCRVPRDVAMASTFPVGAVPLPWDQGHSADADTAFIFPRGCSTSAGSQATH